MRRFVVVAVLFACGDDKGKASIDAPPSMGDDAAIDAPMTSNRVACGDTGTSCPVPEQFCCDVQNGTDTCMPSPPANCSGIEMQCDGTEDCPPGMECCLFAQQNSRCLQTGICGTTGAQSDLMCHVMADCPMGQNCCGTAPGPAADIYSICSPQPCMQ